MNLSLIVALVMIHLLDNKGYRINIKEDITEKN